MSDISDWIGPTVGVVDRRSKGGLIAFPGLDQPTTTDRCTRFMFGGVPDDQLVFLLNVDTRPNQGIAGFPRLNRGWDLCVFGQAGGSLSEPEGKNDLPDWNPAEGDVRNKYMEWERDLATRIEKSAEETFVEVLDNRRRLEGVVAFLDEANDVVRWDFVRIFRVRNALKNPQPNGSYDWMAYKIAPLKGNAVLAQEGGGHGPPSLR